MHLRLLAIASGLVFAAACTGNLQASPSPGGTYPPNAACRPEDVTLKTTVGTFQLGVGLSLDVEETIPNNMACASPDVTMELEDAGGKPLAGVYGSPMLWGGGGTCETNVSVRCSQDTQLYWSNWCGPDAGPVQFAAVAFGGRLRSASPIQTPPPCTNRQVPSALAGIHA